MATGNKYLSTSAENGRYIMFKILYDVPFLCIKDRIINATPFVGIAVCADEEAIAVLLEKMLCKAQSQRKLVVWLRVDESIAERLKQEMPLKVNFVKSEACGFLRHSLAELSFILDSENTYYILEEFDQFSSFEVYVSADDNVNDLLALLHHHPERFDSNTFMTVASKSVYIISKSGDEDELEFISRKCDGGNLAHELLDTMLKHIQALK